MNVFKAKHVIKIMRYEGNGKHLQWDRYKEGENTMHESSTVYTEAQFSGFVECGLAEDLAPLYYSVIR